MTNFDIYDFRFRHHDESGCWNLMFFDFCLEYSYDKMKILELARKVSQVVPEADIYILEDGEMEVDGLGADLPITEEQRRAILDLIEE